MNEYSKLNYLKYFIFTVKIQIKQSQTTNPKNHSLCCLSNSLSNESSVLAIPLYNYPKFYSNTSIGSDPS